MKPRAVNSPTCGTLQGLHNSFSWQKSLKPQKAAGLPVYTFFHALRELGKFLTFVLLEMEWPIQILGNYGVRQAFQNVCRALRCKGQPLSLLGSDDNSSLNWGFRVGFPRILRLGRL